MTAVTTIAGGIAFGAYDVAIAGGVEHMGHHPMGEGVDPNPRFVAEKLVDPSALVMGSTAENLHDRFPHLTKERADAFALASQEKYAKAVRRRQDPARPGAVATRSAEHGWGLATVDEPPRPGTTLDGAGRAEDAVPPARPGHRRQRRRPQRRRHRLPARRRGRRRASSACRSACGWSASPSPASSPRSWASARSRRPRRRCAKAGLTHRRHRPVRAQRGVRRPGAGLPRPLRHRRRRPAGQPVGRRDRRRPPAGLLRRPADDPAGPAVRRAPRGPLRPDRHVRRPRHGRHGDLGEPALGRARPSEHCRLRPNEVVTQALVRVPDACPGWPASSR